MILICIQFLLLYLLLPIPIGNQVSAYNTITRSFYCINEYYCDHEKAHYIYQVNEIGGREKEFKETIIIYVFTQQDDLSKEIVGMLGMPIEEVYAEIYAKTKGNVPPSFSIFYPKIENNFHVINLPQGKFYYAIYNSNN